MTQKVTEIEVNHGLSYTLRRSRRRTIAVEVHPHGELVVRTPLRTPLHEIEGFLTSRRTWIVARLADARDVRQTLPEGREFFLGKVVDELVYELVSELVSEDFLAEFPQRFPRRFPQRFSQRFSGTFSERFPKRLSPGFKRKFLTAFLDHQINALLPSLGVSALRYKKFVVRKMKRRWGSCRADGVLTFNEHLIIAPPRCIKAVVAHELGHLVHLHHGPEFYRLVREIMPDYDHADKELDAWTSVLNRVKGTTNNGARGPVEQRTLWFGPDQADAPAQISLNADLSESAIMSGVRPSMW